MLYICWFGYTKWLPRFPNSRLRSAAWPDQRRATPSYNNCAVAVGRAIVYLTAAAIPGRPEDGSGYSHPRHHVALSQRTLLSNTDTATLMLTETSFGQTRLTDGTDEKTDRRGKFDQSYPGFPMFFGGQLGEVAN